MEKFELNILGCGSALPTMRHLPTSQVLNVRDKLFMIDCGEGAQLQLRKMRLKFSRINHIFLSHLHGDHCFGIAGLLSTLGLLGRHGEFYIHTHPEAEKIFRPFLDYFCYELPFKVIFEPLPVGDSSLIYEDKSIEVTSFPLKHRVPSNGFVFKEKQGLRHLNAEMVKFWKVPIKDLQMIKEGHDWVDADGNIVPNKVLTKDASISRSYAFCSDTAYYEKIIPFIEGVDLLYHEATFAEDAKFRAMQTFHSTARQAAQIALKAGVKKLLIGHYSARYDDDKMIFEEAKSVFNNTIAAKEEMKIII
ncbi:MAG: ribonuclease Z [Bacteroidales bacterium]|nr:ribonuclease Z [Bacteroidales bacterium]